MLKNYFITVFSVFNNKQYPNRPEIFYLKRMWEILEYFINTDLERVSEKKKRKKKKKDIDTIKISNLLTITPKICGIFYLHEIWSSYYPPNFHAYYIAQELSCMCAKTFLFTQCDSKNHSHI